MFPGSSPTPVPDNSADKPWFAPTLTAHPELSHAVFDFDGTLSWLRHGWPEMMVDVLRQQFSLLPGESERTLHDLLLREILALNGKPSIHQMRRGAELALQRGGHPPEPEALLHEYQRRLEAAIADRTHAILSGKSDREDFVIHGARRVLERLAALGLRLIILSGTRQDRVQEEARLLDLARYFGPHIYGGTADVAQSDKRAVLERLLRQEGIPASRLLAFGDGPVELRITKELGGSAVGLASDELHNGSGRIHQPKRLQLLEAGADILLPDYRQPEVWLPRLLGQRAAAS
jgi:phosphoglycolate phosphatase